MAAPVCISMYRCVVIFLNGKPKWSKLLAACMFIIFFNNWLHWFFIGDIHCSTKFWVMQVILVSASLLLLLLSPPKGSGNSSICCMYRRINIVCFFMITLKQVVIFLVSNYSCYQFLCFIFVGKINHENFYAYSNWVFQHTGNCEHVNEHMTGCI